MGRGDRMSSCAMTRDWSPEHRPRRRVVTPDEARIWRAITQDVTPLPGHEMASETEVPAEHPPAPAAVAARPEPVFLPPSPPPKRELPSLSHDQTPGLDRRSAERMKKGEMVIDGRLDLHGLSQDLAHAELLAFIGRAFDAGKRCVLVITGKGTREGSGVLRANVPRWLNQAPLRDRILGFSHARPQHGAEGALYVLIRRKR